MSGRNSFLAGRRGPGCPEPWCPAPGGASGRAGRGPAEVLWREVPSAAELEQADLQGPFRPTVRVSMKDLAPRPQTQRGVPPLPRRLRERREALQRGKPAPSPWSASLALPDDRPPPCRNAPLTCIHGGQPSCAPRPGSKWRRERPLSADGSPAGGAVGRAGKAAASPGNELRRAAGPAEADVADAGGGSRWQPRRLRDTGLELTWHCCSSSGRQRRGVKTSFFFPSIFGHMFS